MSSLRITAGTLRGRRIAVPPGDVRPTSERARQAYFNIIGERIRGANFVDLFAGSGIFSFEALSRGAKSAIAIDRDKGNAAGIEKQSATLGVPVMTLTGDVIATVKRVKDPVDLVYADPPYDYDEYEKLADAIDSLQLTQNAIVAIEHRRGSKPFDRAPGTEHRRLRPMRRAEYGEVWITFLSAGTGITEGG